MNYSKYFIDDPFALVPYGHRHPPVFKYLYIINFKCFYKCREVFIRISYALDNIIQYICLKKKKSEISSEAGEHCGRHKVENTRKERNEKNFKKKPPIEIRRK